MYLAIIILPLLGAIVSGFLGRKIGVTGSQIVTSGAVITTTILATVVFLEVGFSSIPVSLHLIRWIDSESLNVFWGFNFDSLTVSMLIPVLIVSSLVHLYSIGYMSHDPHNQRFFSYLSLFTFMMIILVTSNNFLLMFVGWEGVGICSYLLVSFWYTRIAANQSSLSAFLTNRVGDCFLTVGMFSILWSFGNIDYNTVFMLAPFINENIVTIIGICLLIGAMAKSSQVGLHVWLPMAMEGPTPVSALIHAATMVTAGVYLLMRSSPLIEYSSTVLILCLWLGAITTLFSSLIGLFQQDIKKVIAYSTMSQLGMMVIAVGLSSYNIALFHLVNHAFYKALLFLGAGSVIHAVADNQDFRRYGGLKQFLPLTYSVMLIASLSLVAFPFMTGFYSKDFILESAYGLFTFSGVSVYFIATIGAMFTTLYSVKVLYLTFLANPNGPLNNYKSIHESDIFMSIPLVVLAVFSIFFGYFTRDIFIGLGSGFFIDNSLFIHPNNEIMLNTEFAVNTLYKLLPLFFTISLSIIALVISEFFPSLVTNFKSSRFGYNLFGLLNQRFFIEMFYNKYISNIIFNLGGQTTKVLDKGSIELVGPFGLEKTLVKLSKNLSSLDTGIVTSYALYILIGLIFYILVPYLSLEYLNLLLLIMFAIFSFISISVNIDNKYIDIKTIKSGLPSYLVAILAAAGLGEEYINDLVIYIMSQGPQAIFYSQLAVMLTIKFIITVAGSDSNMPDIDNITSQDDGSNSADPAQNEKSTQPDKPNSNNYGGSGGSGGSSDPNDSDGPGDNRDPDNSVEVDRIQDHIDELMETVSRLIDVLERGLENYANFEEDNGLETELMSGRVTSTTINGTINSELNSRYEVLNNQVNIIRNTIAQARVLQDTVNRMDPENAGDITSITEVENRLFEILIDHTNIFPDPNAHPSPGSTDSSGSSMDPESDTDSLSTINANDYNNANANNDDNENNNDKGNTEETQEKSESNRKRGFDSDDEGNDGPSKRGNHGVK